MTDPDLRRFVVVTLAFVSIAGCRAADVYWRGDPARDAETAKARGDYGPIALREGDSLIVPGFPDSLREINMNFGRLDSVTLGSIAAGQRDSVIKYVATYNAPNFQEVLRVRAAHRRPPR